MPRKTIGNGTHKSADRWSDPKKVPVVYFNLVQFPGNPNEPPRIKIGETGDFPQRLKELSKSNLGVRFEVSPLCTVRGSRADEQQVLRYFAGCKLDGQEETFWPADDLVDYIRWLRDQHFVWVPDDDDCLPVEQLEEVGGSQWMPSPDRRKPAPHTTDLFSDWGPLNLPPRQVTVDDFYTNPVIIEAARAALGTIDLDPASHAFANREVRAARFFNVRDNGLSQPWGGNVWLNPPFSEWQAWVPKIVEEWESGRVAAMCVLCATRTITAQYFSPVHENCAAVCVFKGRIAFWGGRATPSPDDGHAVFYFGRDVPKFAKAFAELGHIYINHAAIPC